MNQQQGEPSANTWIHFGRRVRWKRGETLPDGQDLKKIAEGLGVPADYLIFKDALRNGRVAIPDSTILKLFYEISTMDEEFRTVAKQILDALAFKKRVSEEVGERA